MFTSTRTPLKIGIIFGLIFTLVTGSLFAGANVKRKTVRKGDGTTNINAARDSQGSSAVVTIWGNSVDTYMDEQGVDQVTISVETIEQWIEDANGNLVPDLTFIFGPHGCFFTEPLELKLKGNYVTDNVMLYGEDGEPVEYIRRGNSNQVVFLIPHFSRYAYDQYDYY